MKVFQWLASHKKRLLTAIAALLMAGASVLYLIDGDQKEASLIDAGQKIQHAADQLPADPAE